MIADKIFVLLRRRDYLTFENGPLCDSFLVLSIAAYWQIPINRVFEIIGIYPSKTAAHNARAATIKAVIDDAIDELIDAGLVIVDAGGRVALTKYGAQGLRP